MHRGLKEEDASAAAVMRPWAMEIMRCGPGVREGGRSSGVGIGIVVRIPGIVATQRAAVVTRWHCGQNADQRESARYADWHEHNLRLQ